jgi:hypothetical protein
MEYTQKTNLYHNNEFANMPSIDYYDSHYRLGHFNKETIDWGEVSEIVKSFGLEYALISRTFSDSYIDVVVYHKIQEGDDLPAYCQLLHACINKLDMKTNLYWRTSWGGNVGIFGSHDVKRQTYSFGDRIYDWKNILNCWDPCIYDTKRVMKEGKYLLMDTGYGKIKECDMFHDFNIDDVVTYMTSIAPKYNIYKTIGKTNAETQPYEAVEVDYEDNSYCGHFKFTQDIHDVVVVKVSQPLCGTYEFRLRKNTYEKQLKEALYGMIR